MIPVVPELFLTGPAQEGLRRLEADVAMDVLLVRVNAALDLIETAPGSAEARKLRFREPPSWGIPVGFREHDYIVAWMSGDDFAAWADSADVAELAEQLGDLGTWAVVLYVGPRPV